MGRKAVTIVLLASAMFLAVLCFLRPAKHPDHAAARAAVATRSPQSLGPAQAQAVTPVTSNNVIDTLRRVAGDELHYTRLLSVMGLLADDLNELKGERAVLVASMGDTCEIRVPGLSEEGAALDTRFAAILTRVLGADKVEAVLEDPASYGALLWAVKWDQLSANEHFRFVRTRAETDPRLKGIDGFAGFDVVNTMTWPDSARRASVINHLGFTIGFTGYPGSISWSAMSKVPEGYFRMQKIRGSVDRPARQEYEIYEDLSLQATVIYHYTDPAKDRVIPWKDEAAPKAH